MTIAIAADHAGFDLKQVLIQKLSNQGINCKDFGTYSSESMDYPDVAHPLASALENDELRNRMLHSLDSIEGEVTQLLQQVNITIDDLSTHNKQIDFKRVFC